MGIIQRSKDSITYDFPGMTRFEGVFGVLAALILGGFWIYYAIDSGFGHTVVATRFLVTFLALGVCLFVVFRKNLTTKVTFDPEIGKVVIRKGIKG